MHNHTKLSRQGIEGPFASTHAILCSKDASVPHPPGKQVRPPGKWQAALLCSVGCARLLGQRAGPHHPHGIGGSVHVKLQVQA